MTMMLTPAAVCVLLLAGSVNAFSPGNARAYPGTALAAAGNTESHAASKLSSVVATSAFAVALTLGIAAAPALADEYGRETEAPTLYTGENVMVRFLIRLAVPICASLIAIATCSNRMYEP